MLNPRTRLHSCFMPLATLLLALLLSIRPGFGQTSELISPPGEFVNDVWVSPHDANLIFMAADSPTRLYRSDDRGTSVTAVLNTPGANPKLTFHATSADTLWLLGGTDWISVDGGLTWSDFDRPASQGSVRSMIHTALEDALYLHLISWDTHRLFRSADNGTSWTLQYESPVPLDRLWTRAGAVDTLYSMRMLPPWADGDSIIRSSDGGQSWEYMASGQAGVIYWEMVEDHLRFHPDDPSVWVCSGRVPQGTFAIISTDGGASFDLLYGPWGGPEFVRPEILRDGSLLAITEDNLWRSTDLGQSWTTLMDFPALYPPRDWGMDTDQLMIHPDDSAWLTFQDPHLFTHTADGGNNWLLGAAGMDPVPVLGTTLHPADPEIWFAISLGGLVMSRDSGASWTILNPRYPTDICFHPTDPDRMVQWDAYTIPSITDDGGATWTVLDNLANVTGFAWHPSDPDRMVCVANPPGTPPGAYWSEDGGASWQLAAGGATYQGELFTDPLHPDRVLLRMAEGSSWVLAESIDGGETYSELDLDVDIFGLTLSRWDDSMLALRLDNDGVWSGWHAPDRTGPFTTVVPLPLDRVTQVLPAPDGWIVAATPHNVYVSPDLGDTWVLAHGTAGDYSPSSEPVVAVVDADRMLHSTLPNLYRIDGGLGIEDGGRGRLYASVPRTITLHPAYPNPFNGSLTVPVTAARSEPITVTVFDRLGRRVATLYEGVLSPGEVHLHWSADRVASGVYLLRLTGAAGIDQTRRITLVR